MIIRLLKLSLKVFEVARASVGAVAVASQPERASASSGSRAVQPKAELAKLPDWRGGAISLFRANLRARPPLGASRPACTTH